MDRDLLKNITILYVEDKDEVRENIAKTIKLALKKVITAANGQEGLDIYKRLQNEIDLVITDINMPVMSGLDMCKKIKEIDSDTPMIITTAHNDSNFLHSAISIGIADYIIKPIDIYSMLKTAAKVVEPNILKKRLIQKNVELFNKTAALEGLTNELEHKVEIRTKELKDRLYMDDLTKLKSRLALQEDINNSLTPVVLLADIDAFKSINELYGIDAGNEVLINFAKILEDFAGEKYEVYRISSDEFILFHEAKGAIDKANYEKEALRLIGEVKRSKLFIEEIDEYIEIDITIGLSYEKENILGKADMALGRAKKSSSSFVSFSESIDNTKEMQNNIYWKKEIKEALLEDRFLSFFQPIVDAKQRVIKYEALMRMKKEEDGKVSFVSPFKFLNIAMKTKQYYYMSKMVIEKGMKNFQNKNMDFSINLSYQDIVNREFKNELKEFIEKYDIGKKIIFEILESENIDNYNIMKDFISEFREFGVRVAIDDFGTGFSNFVHILEISPDFVKIDGALVKNIATDKKSYELVKAISLFTEELNIKTIAEFVHSKEVFDIVYDLGIDEFQGYYFSEPLQNI